MTARADELRSRILDLVSEYHDEQFAHRLFVPGETAVPVSGRVFDADELRTLVDSSLDFWLTTGRYAAQFEREFAQFCGVRSAILVNSGSSANLLAVTALTSPALIPPSLGLSPRVSVARMSKYALPPAWSVTVLSLGSFS